MNEMLKFSDSCPSGHAISLLAARLWKVSDLNEDVILARLGEHEVSPLSLAAALRRWGFYLFLDNSLTIPDLFALMFRGWAVFPILKSSFPLSLGITTSEDFYYCYVESISLDGITLAIPAEGRFSLFTLSPSIFMDNVDSSYGFLVIGGVVLPPRKE